jgi:hypothetical protein
MSYSALLEGVLSGLGLEHKLTRSFDIAADAFWLFVLFGLWLWQFEASDEGSLYHWMLATIGFVCLVGVSVLVAVILITALFSRRAC